MTNEHQHGYVQVHAPISIVSISQRSTDGGRARVVARQGRTTISTWRTEHAVKQGQGSTRPEQCALHVLPVSLSLSGAHPGCM